MKRIAVVLIALTLVISGCAVNSSDAEPKITLEVETLASLPSWSHDSVIYEVNVRQYTEEGTFDAFRENLPRLKELGVEILWFMPVHPISEAERKGTLGSYYAVRDYKDINPEFGTMEDFKELVDEAHEMGFKIILDWVANHTGWDNVWIQNKDWYEQDENGNIIYPRGTNWTDVASLNYENADMRAAMIDAMKYWVSEFDIDGYRCDVAGEVPTDFWVEAKRELETIKPVFMLAEDGNKRELLEEAFLSNYGWDLLSKMNSLASGQGTVSGLASYFTSNQRRYFLGTYPMHFVTNHDENSWNGTAYERLGEAHDIMNVLVFTAPGIPLIYSGQEAGLDERLEFFDKDLIDFSSLEKQDFFESLVDLKTGNRALFNGAAGGDFVQIRTDDKEVLIFEREAEGNRVVVLLNFSEEPAEFEASEKLAGKYSNYFTKTDFDIETGETVELGKWGYMVLIAK